MIKLLRSKTFFVKIICLILLLVFALLSIFVISKPLTSPETYKATISSIDEKKLTVASITTAAAAASTAIAAIPSDATTPIANQIMEISSYLMIVVCILVLEKSLLTVMGYLSFNFIIPIACALLAISLFVYKRTLKVFAVKLIAFALILVLIVPISVKISDMICEINSTTIEQVSENLEANTNQEDTEKSWWDKAIGTITNAAENAAEGAKQLLNNFIDAIATFVIAYCVIPILVAVFGIWIIKILFGINIPIPKPKKVQFFKNNGGKTKGIETDEEKNELAEV